MYYQVCLCVCPEVCMCFAFPFNSTFGGGEVKGVIHNSSTKPRASSRFTWYTRVLGFTILLQIRGI